MCGTNKEMDKDYSLTTTVFRKKEHDAFMACDSRSSLVDKSNGMITKWFDSAKYKKTINIDGVMYGFAGLNTLYKIFLENYSDRETSEDILDAVVELAKNNIAQFMLMRYDGENLKIFAYSPPNALHRVPEIYKISSDLPIETDCYAIGSGKDSKMYLKHQFNASPQVPIHQIISTNKTALSKKKYRHLVLKVSKGNTLTTAESLELYKACSLKGGDLFTGGIVNMCKNATKQEIIEQVAIMEDMDKQAKASGAVCASPINAALEKAHLESLGHSAVSSNRVVMNENMSRLLEKMQDRFDASI